MADRKELISELHNLADAIEHRQMKVALTMRRAADALEEAGRDAERLDWLAHHGVSIRQDSADLRWFLVAPYHMGNAAVDNHEREDSARAAIDAALINSQKDR